VLGSGPQGRIPRSLRHSQPLVIYRGLSNGREGANQRRTPASSRKARGGNAGKSSKRRRSLERASPGSRRRAEPASGEVPRTPGPLLPRRQNAPAGGSGSGLAIGLGVSANEPCPGPVAQTAVEARNRTDARGAGSALGPGQGVRGSSRGTGRVHGQGGHAF